MEEKVKGEDEATSTTNQESEPLGWVVPSAADVLDLVTSQLKRADNQMHEPAVQQSHWTTQ